MYGGIAQQTRAWQRNVYSENVLQFLGRSNQLGLCHIRIPFMCLLRYVPDEDGYVPIGPQGLEFLASKRHI